MHEKIAEKWAWKFFSEKENVSLTSQIQSAIDEATKAQQKIVTTIEARQRASGEREQEHQKRIAELETTNKNIAEKIDQLSPYEKFMSHGEHQSVAEEYDDLMSEIRDLVENRPDKQDGMSKYQSRCTCPSDGSRDCDYCKRMDFEMPQYAELEQQAHEQQNHMEPEPSDVRLDLGCDRKNRPDSHQDGSQQTNSEDKE